MIKNNYLIIDDDSSFGNKLKESFQNRGLNAKHAASLGEALECIKKDKIDRVILDLKLDQENGLNFFNQIEHYKNSLEVLVLTGYGSVQTVKLALKKGAVNYLQKPASIAEILNGFDSISEEISISQPTLEHIENDHINRVLVEQKGNISKSAKILGLHRRSLQRKLKNS